MSEPQIHQVVIHFPGPAWQAAADPAVKSGLLTYEIRPWYVPMRRDQGRSDRSQ